MYSRIAFVKTGWSDEYRGDPVIGRHAHVQDYAEAHERFNFLKSFNGNYYAYLPPIGKKLRPPQPKETSGWLLIFVAARNGSGPLTVVGWYKDAVFYSEYIDRPEYSETNGFENDIHGSKYHYCISARAATLIPTQDRSLIVRGDHFKRTPILYVRGNGKSDRWREDLAKLAESIVSDRSKTSRPPHLAFPDADTRTRIEVAAINAAKRLLREQHDVIDRQKDNCGYDLLAVNRRTKNELHVEVKGTSATQMHFYMSRNEFRYMYDPRWRLLMVTNALRNPELRLMDLAEVRSAFDINPFAWEAVAKI